MGESPSITNHTTSSKIKEFYGGQFGGQKTGTVCRFESRIAKADEFDAERDILAHRSGKLLGSVKKIEIPFVPQGDTISVYFNSGITGCLGPLGEMPPQVSTPSCPDTSRRCPGYEEAKPIVICRQADEVRYDFEVIEKY